MAKGRYMGWALFDSDVKKKDRYIVTIPPADIFGSLSEAKKARGNRKGIRIYEY